ncbi:hypothetical protein NGA_2028000, partial [Nannochloropsis gaditana CCMP526]|uniref:uncharacterized protein n=1 Tax=Nannochloropsis gaditana (strain CCMP526) TaxID=1093141 RepID=UPI00029F5CB0
HPNQPVQGFLRGRPHLRGHTPFFVSGALPHCLPRHLSHPSRLHAIHPAHSPVRGTAPRNLLWESPLPRLPEHPQVLLLHPRPVAAASPGPSLLHLPDRARAAGRPSRQLPLLLPVGRDHGLGPRPRKADRRAQERRRGGRAATTLG